MCDDEPTPRSTQRFDDRSQPLRDVREALALRRPEMHRILAPLREPGRDRVTCSRSSVWPSQVPKSISRSAALNFERSSRRDDLARLQTAPHRTDQAPFEVKGFQFRFEVAGIARQPSGSTARRFGRESVRPGCFP